LIVCSPFLSTALVLLELALAVASVSLTIPGSAHYLAAGVLEWVVAFSGTAYLWLFCGFLGRYVSFFFFLAGWLAGGLVGWC
jgi:hypothetical protein